MFAHLSLMTVSCIFFLQIHEIYSHKTEKKRWENMYMNKVEWQRVWDAAHTHTHTHTHTHNSCHAKPSLILIHHGLMSNTKASNKNLLLITLKQLFYTHKKKKKDLIRKI